MAFIRDRLPEHMAIRTLTLDDIDEFERVEKACFPPAERCTREKFAYRISVCPELSAGVFLQTFDEVSGDDEDEDGQGAAEGSSEDPANSRNEGEKLRRYSERNAERNIVVAAKSHLRSERLVGHILGTKMTTKYVTDEAMEIGSSTDKDEKAGHREEGRTIGIHSVCVDPEFQGKKIGTIMLRDYIQRFSHMHVADNIALIAHDELVPFYKNLEFEDLGLSECQFGGSKWRNMSLELVDDEE